MANVKGNNAKKGRTVQRRGSMFDGSTLMLNRTGASVCTFSDDPTSEIFGPNKGAAVKYLNSYKMEPDKRFNVTEVQDIAKQVLTEHLEEMQYCPVNCKQQTKEIAESIKNEVKALGYNRHKIIVFVNIGQKRDHGVQFGSRCLWDAKRDNWAEAKFTNTTLWATATVYGVYYE